MKNSNTWKVVLACCILLAAASVAVLINPAAQKYSEKPTKAIQIKQAKNSFAITNVRIFDGEKTIEKTSVLIEKGRIAAIGSDIKIPDNTPIYCGAGKTLLPGLIDSHTHTYGDAQRDALRFGVTTEMDMFTDWKMLAAAKKQRESYARTELADLWSAGTLATVPEGHGTEYRLKIPTLSKVEQVPAFIQERVNEGSDYIKIVLDDGSAYGPNIKLKTFMPDVTQALINTSHAHNKKVLVHIGALKDAKQVVAQGADGLAHVFIDQVVDSNFIQLAKQKGAFIVPTLSVTGSLARAHEGEKLAFYIHIKPYLSLAQTTSLKAGFPSQWTNKLVLDNALESVKQLHAAGVPLLAGTDAGNPSTTHGASMHGELALLVRAGLSPIQALNSATALPAKIFNLADRGRIAIGMRADLILVNGDPTQQIEATRDISEIWKNGYRIIRLKTNDVAVLAAPIAPENMISDFEQGKINSRYGVGWSISTDMFMNGKSTATLSLVDNGANNSKGAMTISGKIKQGFSFPWVGAFFGPGEKAMQPINYSKAKELVFWVKGDGRQYNVMAFSSTQGGVPPSQTFIAGADWKQIRLALASFDGLELSQVTGFSFNAGAPEGKFNFMIDNIEIR